jgi:hypothetical protein
MKESNKHWLTYLLKKLHVRRTKSPDDIRPNVRPLPPLFHMDQGTRPPPPEPLLIFFASILKRPNTQLSEGYQPRYGMTCHRVGNRQLLSVGGFQTYNLSTSCDWQDKGVHIYDMSTLTWGSAYNAKADAYTVPVQVVRQIGGR